MNKSVFSFNYAISRDVISHEVIFSKESDSFIERMEVEDIEIKFKVFEDYLCYIGNHSNVFNVGYVTVRKLLKEDITDELSNKLKKKVKKTYFYPNLSKVYENHLMRMLKLLDKNIFNGANLIYNRVLMCEDIYISWLYLNVLWFLLERISVDFDLSNIEEKIKNKIIEDKIFPFVCLKSKKATIFLSSILTETIENDIEPTRISTLLHSYVFNFEILPKLKSDFVLLDFFRKYKNKQFYLSVKTFDEIVIMANKCNCISEVVSYTEKVINEKNYYNGKEYIISIKNYGDKINTQDKELISKLYKLCEKHKRDTKIIVRQEMVDIDNGGIQMHFESLEEMRNWYIFNFLNILSHRESIDDLIFTNITDDGNRFTITGFETKTDLELQKLNIVIFESFINNNNLRDIFETFFIDKNNKFKPFFEKFVSHFDIYCNYTFRNNISFAEEILAEGLILLVEPALRAFIRESEELELIIPENSRCYIDRVSLLQQLYDMFEKYSCMDKVIFKYIKDRIVGTMGRAVENDSKNKVEKEELEEEKSEEETNKKIEGMRNRYLHGLMFNLGSCELVNIFVFVLLVLMDITESYENIK